MDVALCKLNKPLEMGKNTAVATLATIEDEIKPGSECWVAGWGNSTHNNYLLQ